MFNNVFRRTPTANAEGLDRPGGWRRERSRPRRVFRHHQNRPRALGARRRHAPRYRKTNTALGLNFENILHLDCLMPSLHFALTDPQPLTTATLTLRALTMRLEGSVDALLRLDKLDLYQRPER